MSTQDEIDAILAKLGGDNGSLEECDLQKLSRSRRVCFELLADMQWHSTSEITRFGMERKVSDVMRRVRQLSEYYQIVRKRSDGQFWYRWTGSRREMVVPRPGELRKMQDAYYQSEHWQSVRAERLEFDDWKCTLCGTQEEELHVHHWFYRLFEEELMDVQTFCSQCHDRLHVHSEVVRRAAFPKRLPKDVAVALGWKTEGRERPSAPPIQPGQQGAFWSLG